MKRRHRNKMQSIHFLLQSVSFEVAGLHNMQKEMNEGKKKYAAQIALSVAARKTTSALRKKTRTLEMYILGKAVGIINCDSHRLPDVIHIWEQAICRNNPSECQTFLVINSIGWRSYRYHLINHFFEAHEFLCASGKNKRLLGYSKLVSLMIRYVDVNSIFVINRLVAISKWSSSQLFF